MCTSNPRVFLISEFRITSSTKVLPKPSRILFGTEAEKGRIRTIPWTVQTVRYRTKIYHNFRKMMASCTLHAVHPFLFLIFPTRGPLSLVCMFVSSPQKSPFNNIERTLLVNRGRNISLGQREILWEYSHSWSASRAVLSSIKLSRFVMLFGFECEARTRISEIQSLRIFWKVSCGNSLPFVPVSKVPDYFLMNGERRRCWDSCNWSDSCNCKPNQSDNCELEYPASKIKLCVIDMNYYM